MSTVPGRSGPSTRHGSVRSRLARVLLQEQVAVDRLGSKEGRAERDGHDDHHVDGNRPPGAGGPRDQRSADEGCETAAEDGGELASQGDPGVPVTRTEEL